MHLVDAPANQHVQRALGGVNMRFVRLPVEDQGVDRLITHGLKINLEPFTIDRDLAFGVDLEFKSLFVNCGNVLHTASFAWI